MEKTEIIDSLRKLLTILEERWDELSLGGSGYPLLRLSYRTNVEGDIFVLVVGVDINNDD